jgi:carboxypeptidase Taq
VSYPLHVVLRYEIERALVEGEIECEDVPALWDERMQAWLGIDSRGNYKDGPMQDVHWPSGMFGYFPSYLLGAMYAAQWFAAMRRQMPDLDSRIEAGDFTPVFDWLRTHIWQQGSRWTTDELAVRASGETLNPVHFKVHLEAEGLAVPALMRAGTVTSVRKPAPPRARPSTPPASACPRATAAPQAREHSLTR